MNNSQQKIDNRRRDMAGILAIVSGLALGLFIKRIKLGLIIGIVLGFIAYSLLRRK
jgi:F0F1-type ATP synthase assembly protein I